MTDRRRRPHPAQGARILTAGLSTAAVLGITAALGLAQQPAAAPPVGGTPSAVTAPTPGGASAASPGVRPVTPRVRPATPAPFVTTTRPDARTHGSR
jgi:hypothetical protein